MDVVNLEDETIDVEALNSMAVMNEHFHIALSSSNLYALRKTDVKKKHGNVNGLALWKTRQGKTAIELWLFYSNVTNHGVPLEASKETTEVAYEFFKLPVEEKMKLYSDNPSN